MFGIKIALYFICIVANIFLLGTHEYLQMPEIKYLAYMNLTLIGIGIVGDMGNIRKGDK